MGCSNPYHSSMRGSVPYLSGMGGSVPYHSGLRGSVPYHSGLRGSVHYHSGMRGSVPYHSGLRGSVSYHSGKTHLRIIIVAGEVSHPYHSDGEVIVVCGATLADSIRTHATRLTLLVSAISKYLISLSRTKLPT